MTSPANHMQDDETRHVAMLEDGFDIPARVAIDIVPVRGGEEHGFGADAGGGSPQLLPVERNARRCHEPDFWFAGFWGGGVVHCGKIDSIHQQAIMLCPSLPFGARERADPHLPSCL